MNLLLGTVVENWQQAQEQFKEELLARKNENLDAAFECLCKDSKTTDALDSEVTTSLLTELSRIGVIHLPMEQSSSAASMRKGLERRPSQERMDLILHELDSSGDDMVDKEEFHGILVRACCASYLASNPPPRLLNPLVVPRCAPLHLSV